MPFLFSSSDFLLVFLFTHRRACRPFLSPPHQAVQLFPLTSFSLLHPGPQSTFVRTLMHSGTCCANSIMWYLTTRLKMLLYPCVCMYRQTRRVISFHLTVLWSELCTPGWRRLTVIMSWKRWQQLHFLICKQENVLCKTKGWLATFDSESQT